MAEVHIVDIDGEQWDMKDQPLTERVAALGGQVQENTEVIRNINKDVKTPFKAVRGITKVKFIAYESCFISGYISGVGTYMAVLANLYDEALIVHDLFGSVSNHLTITPLGSFEFELSLDGVINIFGMISSVS